MSYSYILCYDDAFGDRDKVKGYMNSIPQITHWRYDLPHCFYVVSTSSSADIITNQLRRLSGEQGRFFFMQYHENSQGWLTAESWYLLNNKNYKP